MSDTLFDIVDGLVESLAESFPTLEINDAEEIVSVEWPENPRIELSDQQLTKPLIWVVDVGESCGIHSGCPIEEFTVLVVVQMKQRPTDVAADFIRAMSGFAAEIVRHFRDRDTSLEIADCVCVGATRKNSKDFTDWNEKGRFYSEILTTWRMA